jgi:hypothetical protein
MLDVRTTVPVGANGSIEGSERGDRGADASTDGLLRADAERLGISLDEYKRRFGVLVKDGSDTWQGSLTDPFGRRVQIDGDEYPRVVSGDFTENRT